MFRHLFLVAVILIGSSSVVSGALPSYRGYTGLMIIPTADALGKGDWNTAAFAEDLSSETINGFCVNYGLAENLEVGINRFRLDTNTRAQTQLNGKYMFMPETPGHPAISVGVMDVTNDVKTTVYLAASKTLGESEVYKGEVVGSRVHVGMGGGRLSGLFLGFSSYLGRNFQFMAEWDSVYIQAGVRLRVTPQVTIHAGGLNLTDRQGGTTALRDEPFFGLGVSINSSY